MNEKGKKYGFYALGIIFLVAAGVVWIVGLNKPSILPLCGAMTVVSAIFFKKSSHSKKEKAFSRLSKPAISGIRNVGFLAWLVGIAVLILLAVAFYGLYQDALNGYKEISPVHFFTGMILVCAIVWPYIICKLTSYHRE